MQRLRNRLYNRLDLHDGVLDITMGEAWVHGGQAQLKRGWRRLRGFQPAGTIYSTHCAQLAYGSAEPRPIKVIFGSLRGDGLA